MNSFEVEFHDNVTAAKMVAGIRSVANDQAYSQDGDSFTFEAKWETDPKSLHNLRGKIERTSGMGSVKSISAQ